MTKTLPLRNQPTQQTLDQLKDFARRYRPEKSTAKELPSYHPAVC